MNSNLHYILMSQYIFFKYQWKAVIASLVCSNKVKVLKIKPKYMNLLIKYWSQISYLSIFINSALNFKVNCVLNLLPRELFIFLLQVKD